MRPDEYEFLVAEYFENKGYETKVSSYSNDYGVDVFATKGKTKIAIQAKMFGNSTRPVNRQMIMELHGAKDYFDCHKAILATDGRVIENAKEVAKKLGIEILNIPAVKQTQTKLKKSSKGKFEDVWEQFIIPLQGKTLKRDDGKSNKILKVDWSGIERVTSNGRNQKIKIEIFKQTFNYLLKNKQISRAFINDEYPGRASSGVILILSQAPNIDVTNNPKGLKLMSEK